MSSTVAHMFTHSINEGKAGEALDTLMSMMSMGTYPSGEMMHDFIHRVLLVSRL